MKNIYIFPPKIYLKLLSILVCASLERGRYARCIMPGVFRHTAKPAGTVAFPLSSRKRDFLGQQIRIEHCVCKYRQCPRTRASAHGLVTVGKKNPQIEVISPTSEGKRSFHSGSNLGQHRGRGAPLQRGAGQFAAQRSGFSLLKGPGKFSRRQRTKQLVPSGIRPSPHFALLGGVHGGAQGAAEMLRELPGVGDGANDTEARGAVRVGDEPFVRALRRAN